MAEPDKPWYKSKGKIGGLGLILCGTVNAIADLFNLPFRIPLWTLELLAGLTGVGIRDALNKK